MKRSLHYLVLAISLLAFTHANGQGWQWAVSGQGQVDEYGKGVVTDAAGNVYMVGTFNSASLSIGFSTFTNPTSGSVTILVKFDANGNPVWGRLAGGNSNGNAIAIDNAGYIYITGGFAGPSITFGTTTLINNNSSLSYDVFLVKYDPGGNVIWAKSMGGSDDDVANSVVTDAVGNVYVAGFFNSRNITFGATVLTNDSAGKGTLFLAKYDNAGNTQWAKSAYGALNFWGPVAAADPSGNVCVTGYFQSPLMIFGNDTLVNGLAPNEDMFLAKYDSSGNVLWARSPCTSVLSYGNAIATDSRGDIYAGGYYWGKTAIFEDTTLINPDTSGNSEGLFFVKYDAAGNLIRVKTAIGDEGGAVNAIATDAFDNVYVSGNSMSDLIVFDNDTLPGDIFLVKYDSAGNALWATGAFGRLRIDYPAGITLDKAQNLYMTGTYGSKGVQFGSCYLVDTNNYDLFIAKFSTLKTGLPAVSTDQKIAVYPNPVQKMLTITSPDGVRSVAISNLVGQTVYSQAYNAPDVQIDVNDLTPGVYLLKINGTELRKLIKE